MSEEGRLNIRQMQTPSPEAPRTVEFDFEKYFPPEVRKEMREDRYIQRNEKNWKEFLRIAGPLHVLGVPDVELTPEERSEIEEWAKQKWTNSSGIVVHQRAEFLLPLKALGFDLVQELGCAQELYKEYRDVTTGVKIRFHPDTAAKMAYQMQFLGLDVSQDVISRWDEFLSKLFPLNEGNAHGVVLYAMYLKVFKPQEELFSKEQWKLLRKYIPLEFRYNAIYMPAEYAAALQVLSSDDVHITERGIELVRKAVSASGRDDGMPPVPVVPQI